MTTLCVDLDTKRHAVARRRTLRLLHTLAAEIGGAWTIEERRSSRGGLHYLITTSHELRVSEVVAVQLLLGSDLARERYNFSRAMQIERGNVPEFWVTRFNVLYDQKPARKGGTWRKAE